MQRITTRAIGLALALALAGCGGGGALRDHAGGPISAAPEIRRPPQPLQCVPYARDRSGIAIKGDAGDWWAKAEGLYPRSNQPAPGAVLVLEGYRDSSRGHVAVVSRIIDPRTIVVDHANWLNGGEINLDTPVRDVSGRGDWSAVQVWHTPSRQFGRRVYRAKGFIHPFRDLAALEFAPR